MTLARTVGEILGEHTTLEVESIDRMYRNVYVPGLQYGGGVARPRRRRGGSGPRSAVTRRPASPSRGW